MPKEENVISEALQSIRFLLRHRKGNEIPGAILDTFDNLGFTTKDGRKPVMSARRKAKHGWHLVFTLPPGISFSEVTRKREHFQDATNSWIEMKWLNGKLHMDIHAGSLPASVPYEWDAAAYSKMDLPVPIGISQQGMEVLDLARAPHFLIGGVTGYGKSNLIHVLINSLIGKAIVAIIDFKRLEYVYLRNYCALARYEKEALALLKALNREMERRLEVLESAECVKVQDYAGDMPFIVLVIDELAEVKNDEIMNLIDRIVRLARAVGISVIGATQRPSVKVLPGDTRANFAARICFQAADEIDSRVILGENCSLAARLPAIPGRAIFKYGLLEREVQTMYLPPEKARAMLKNVQVRRWNYELPEQPKKKRLLPR